MNKTCPSHTSLPVHTFVLSRVLSVLRTVSKLDVVTVRDITPDKSEATAEAALVDHMGAVVCFHQPILGRLASLDRAAGECKHRSLFCFAWGSAGARVDVVEYTI